MSSNYQLSGVQLVQSSDEVWIVEPTSSGWFVPVVGGILLTAIGLFFLLAVTSAWFLSVFFFIAAAYYATAYPLAAEVRFDFSARELIFKASYLLRRSRHVEWNVPFQQLSSLSLRPQPLGKRHVAQLRLQDGAELVMDFGRRTVEAEQFVQRFTSTAATSRPVISSPAPISPHIDATIAQARVQRETRSWGTWLILMGFLQMVNAQGLSPWGVVLIIVGAASFYFREAPMLVVYAVTVGWAGVNNVLFTTTIFWKGFAVLQAWIVFLLFRQFWQFQRAEKLAAEEATASPAETTALPASPRTARWFPLIALLLGGGALLLFVAALGSAFVLHNRDLLPLITLLETFAVNTAVLGVATGLAGWLGIVSNKWASIVGCLAGGLTLVAELAIPLIIDSLH